MYQNYGKIRHNKIEINGYKFDSKLEGKYYEYLLIQKSLKKIKDLKIHPSYIIQDGFKKNNITYRKIVYCADFSFYDITKKKTRVIDVKGWETPVFKLKRKMFEFKYPQYTLELMKYRKATGWYSDIKE